MGGKGQVLNKPCRVGGPRYGGGAAAPPPDTPCWIKNLYSGLNARNEKLSKLRGFEELKDFEDFSLSLTLSH